MRMGICVWAQNVQMFVSHGHAHGTVSQKSGGRMTPSVMSPSICIFGNPSEGVMGP